MDTYILYMWWWDTHQKHKKANQLTQTFFHCLRCTWAHRKRGCRCNHFNNYTWLYTCNHGLMYKVIFLTPLHSMVTSRSHWCLTELSTALLACSATSSNGVSSKKVSGSSALHTNHATPSTMISDTISYDPYPVRWSSWRKCNWYLSSWS